MTATAKTTASAESRRAPRKTTRTLAYIVGERIFEPVECTVLDLSMSGAKLKINKNERKAFTPSIDLPETFRIELPRDKMRIDCQLAWQTEDMIGVSFLSAFKPIAAPVRKK